MTTPSQARSGKEKLYDVVAVDLKSSTVRVFDRAKTWLNAEAIKHMAVMRRGCDEEFFATTPTGQYNDGDTWKETT